MKLKEYEGKELFKKYSLNVPKGFVVSNSADISLKFEGFDNVVVKSQILVGGRGKAGGIKKANAKNVESVVKEVLSTKIKGFDVKEVLIEEMLSIDKELYLSLMVNRSDRNITLIFSEEGGIDIEELSKNNPEKIFKLPMVQFDAIDVKQKLKQFSNNYYGRLLPVVEKLYKMMKDLDCELVEINPLIESNEKLIAADSKVIIDDNALFRQNGFKLDENGELTEIETKARDYGLNYVELDGDIAIIGNGAGLVMATLDVVNHFGGSCANFLDVGGGASVDKMEQSLEIVLMKQPKGVFINIFGGITRCDLIAQGLVNYIKKKGIEIPVVVRMIGTNETEGKQILKDNNISSLDSMEECAKKIVEKIK